MQSSRPLVVSTVLLVAVVASVTLVTRGQDQSYPERVEKLSEEVKTLRRELSAGVTRIQTEGNAVPAGSVVAYAGGTLPPGWLLCNGQSVSKAAYPQLWRAIGDRFGNGGDEDSDTFNLPDYRARFLRMARSGQYPTGTGGSDELEGHRHTVSGQATNIEIPRRSIDSWMASQIPERIHEVGSWDKKAWALTIPATGAEPREGHGHTGGWGRISGATSHGGGGDNRPRFHDVHFLIKVH